MERLKILVYISNYLKRTIRVRNIYYKNKSLIFTFIPNFMLKAVIKNENFSLYPMNQVISNPQHTTGWYLHKRIYWVPNILYLPPVDQDGFSILSQLAHNEVQCGPLNQELTTSQNKMDKEKTTIPEIQSRWWELRCKHQTKRDCLNCPKNDL